MTDEWSMMSESSTTAEAVVGEAAAIEMISSCSFFMVKMNESVSVSWAVMPDGVC